MKSLHSSRKNHNSLILQERRTYTGAPAKAFIE